MGKNLRSITNHLLHLYTIDSSMIMNFAGKIGLTDEEFCKTMVLVKMFGMVAVLGHTAELRYEKYLKSKNIKFDKAENDKHFDYIVNGERNQVKRFETGRTTLDKLVANLTKTHGNRTKKGTGSNYFRRDFDNLVILDINGEFHTVKVSDIEAHRKRPNQLSSSHTVKRDLCVKEYKKNYSTTNSVSNFQSDFLDALKQKNENYPPAIEELRKKYKIQSYVKLWTMISGLTLDETFSLFTVENFRLITAAKGFCAEEHFNKFLKENKIKYKQNIAMYAKSDHDINGHGYQVKTTYPNGTTSEEWAFKTHKSHGHGEGELYKNDAFDIIAVFVGYEPQTKSDLEIQKEKTGDKYTPASVKTNFIFVPIDRIEEHPDHPGFLKRVSKVLRSDYTINDLTNF